MVNAIDNICKSECPTTLLQSVVLAVLLTLCISPLWKMEVQWNIDTQMLTYMFRLNSAVKNLPVNDLGVARTRIMHIEGSGVLMVVIPLN